jgi:hypothetical protein
MEKTRQYGILMWNVISNGQKRERREVHDYRLQRISEADEASLGLHTRTRSEPSGGKYFKLRSVPSGERGRGGSRGGVRGKG